MSPTSSWTRHLEQCNFPPDLTTFPKAPYCCCCCFFYHCLHFSKCFYPCLEEERSFSVWSFCHLDLDVTKAIEWISPFLLAHSLSPPLLTFRFSYTVWRPIAPSLPTLPQHHPAAFTLGEAGQVLIHWRTCSLSRKNVKPLQCLKFPPTLLYFSTWRCFQLQRK